MRKYLDLLLGRRQPTPVAPIIVPAANDDEDDADVVAVDEEPFVDESWDSWPLVDPQKFSVWYVGNFDREPAKLNRVFAALSEYCQVARRRPPPRKQMFNLLRTAGWRKERRRMGGEEKVTLYLPPPESR